MIDWSKNITEPPLTKDLNLNELKNLIIENAKENVIFKFPCHNQAVERHVKLVTECSSKICNEEPQNKLAKSIITSRKRMPKFNTKKDFVV